ncbi:MAG: YkgJ family cysteine cluster protein [Desulfobacteraceae bacterium]|jgi:Fe-S-cluster containining protein
MEPDARFDAAALKTLFHECRQCGVCCKKYRKIPLYPDEVDFIKKMGGHVGVNASLAQLRDKSLKTVIDESKAGGEVYMIHPDEKGCVFLQKHNGKYICKIYHHRPRTCRGFRCNMADNTFLDIFGQDATTLLGLDRFGLPIKSS